MNLVRWIITAAVFCVMMAGRIPAYCAQTGRSADIAFLATWMQDLQFRDSARSSFGAIKVHHTVAAVGADGKPYYRISPYLASLGVLGLMKTHVPARLQTAERWMTWYFAHLNPESAPDGVPYEHFYLADGSGETTCIKPGDPHLCHYNDATDSAAATFCAVIWAYVQSGGKADLVNSPSRKQKMEALGNLLLSLQQPDGLCWAKQDWRARYLEDNCEVYDGFSALSHLEQAVYKDPKRAAEFSAAASRVKQGILTELYDPASSLYSAARFEDGSHPAANLAKWYPDTQAQVWPHLFGVVLASDPRTRSVMRAIAAHWNGKAGPDWAAAPELVNDGWIDADFAYAMLQAGARSQAAIYLEAARRLKFPTDLKAKGADWPFTVADAGWLLRLLMEMEKR